MARPTLNASVAFFPEQGTILTLWTKNNPLCERLTDVLRSLDPEGNLLSGLKRVSVGEGAKLISFSSECSIQDVRAALKVLAKQIRPVKSRVVVRWLPNGGVGWDDLKMQMGLIS